MFRTKLLSINYDKLFKFKFKKNTPALWRATNSHFSNKKFISNLIIIKNNLFLKTNSSNLEINLNKYISKSTDEKCWKCKKNLEIKNFTCTSCGALQYPKPTVNFFELLGVSQMYDINMEELSQKFRDLQMNFHPDKFANKSKEELEISEIYSRLINKAYTTLKDPIARGMYLLDFQKFSKEPLFPLDQEFLISIMEKNEELENADDHKTLLVLNKTNNENIEQKISAIKDAFRTNRLQDAKVNLTKLNYYLRLSEKIKEKESDFNSNKND